MASNAIEIRLGEDLQFTMSVTDANGQPVADLSGYACAFQARASEAAAAALLDLSTENGKVTREPGQFRFTIAPADGAGITIADGVGDVLVTDPFDKTRHATPKPFPITFIPSVVR